MKWSFVFALLTVALLALAAAKRHHRRGRDWSTRANHTVGKLQPSSTLSSWILTPTFYCQGERLKKWSKKPRHERRGYPHEQGGDIYHEFDIMLPPGQDANGVSLANKPNVRWPNAVVPYVIAGSFSNWSPMPRIDPVLTIFVSNFRFIASTNHPSSNDPIC